MYALQKHTSCPLPIAPSFLQHVLSSDALICFELAYQPPNCFSTSTLNIVICSHAFRDLQLKHVSFLVRFWDVESGSQIGRPLRRHDGSVMSARISADGQTVVSVWRDGNVCLFQSRNASGTHWKRCSAWLLPRSEIWSFTFADGEESSSGVMGWLVCPISREPLVFELMKP